MNRLFSFKTITILFAFLFTFTPVNVTATTLLELIDGKTTEEVIGIIEFAYNINDKNDNTDWIIKNEETEFLEKISTHHTFEIVETIGDNPFTISVIDDGKGYPEGLIFSNVLYSNVEPTFEALGIPITYSFEEILDPETSQYMGALEYKNTVVKLINLNSMFKEKNMPMLINDRFHYYNIQAALSERMKEKLLNNSKE